VRYLVALLVIGSLCVAAILFFRRSAPLAIEKQRIAEQVVELTVLRTENAQLKAALAVRSTLDREHGNPPPATSHPEGLARLKSVRDLVASRQVNLSVDLLNYYEGTLTNEFIDLFSLSENERLILESAIQEARRDLARAATSRATVTRLSAGHYTLHVPPFIEEGRSIYNRVSDAFESTLGHERNLIFSELMGESLERSFNVFGAEERRLILTRKIEPDGTRSFHLDDRRIFGENAFGSSQSSATSFEQMKKYPGFGDLLNLFPEEAATE
jgi:hypothetical protein